MSSPTLSRFISLLAAATGFLYPVALRGQAEIRYVTLGAAFAKAPPPETEFLLFGSALQIRAHSRKDLFVTAPLNLPTNQRSEITRIVVRFRNPNRSAASLLSIRLTDDSSGKLLDETTFASGDRSSVEVPAPSKSANSWQLPSRKPPLTASARTVVRLGIDSPMGIEGGAGDPFLLIEVDVYVKNPNQVLGNMPPNTKTSTTSGGNGVILMLPSGPASTPAPAPASAIPNLPDSRGVIYLINDAKQLLWYRHDGRERGTSDWASSNGTSVGVGWDFRTVIGAGNGVMYGVTREGDLMWYRHTGAGNGSVAWVLSEGKKVNSGFRGMQIVAAGGGVIYGLKRNGELYWFRHDGFQDGADRWTAREGRLIASDWSGSTIFAGDASTLYASRHGELYRYRHLGREDGSSIWANPDGQKIASNWNYPFPFSSGDGIIYALNDQQQLLWFRDEGYADDTVRWANGGTGKIIGVGWRFTTIFSGAVLKP